MAKHIVCKLMINSTTFINTCYGVSHVFSLEIRVDTFYIKWPMLWLSEVRILWEYIGEAVDPDGNHCDDFFYDNFVHLGSPYNLSSKPEHIWRWKRTLFIITWGNVYNVGISRRMASLFHLQHFRCEILCMSINAYISICCSLIQENWLNSQIWQGLACATSGFPSKRPWRQCKMLQLNILMLSFNHTVWIRDLVVNSKNTCDHCKQVN